MKLTIRILTMGILSMLFGCKQPQAKPKTQDIFPKESFSVIKAMYQGKPIVGSINQAYKSYGLKSQYPWYLKISIGLEPKNLYDNGLPNQSESALAYDLEDSMVAKIQKLATAHYVGHIFIDTFLEIYIYLDDPKKVNEYLKAEVNKEGLVRGLAYEMKQDPEWKAMDKFFK